jgi:hypothetical protein
LQGRERERERWRGSSRARRSSANERDMDRQQTTPCCVCAVCAVQGSELQAAPPCLLVASDLAPHSNLSAASQQQVLDALCIPFLPD